MRNISMAVGVAGLLGLFSACGGNDRAGALPDGTGGTGKGGARPAAGSSSRAGTGGDGGAGGDGDESPSNAPLVNIISPTESLTPDDGVIIEQVVHVVCAVASSNAPTAADVDPTSVRLAVRDSTGKTIEEKDASTTKIAGEYAADFVLATVPSGKISFLCSASDENKVQGFDALSSFVDHGPEITVVTPKKDSAHPLKGGLAIEFQVAPVPLVPGDSGASVDDVTFSLDGKDFDLDVSGETYTASLQLDDTDVFPVNPSGAVVIKATNRRAPEPVTATESYGIVVDGEGPVISIQSPLPQKVVGGKVTLEFTASDAGSGVDPESVNVTLYPDAPQIFFDAKKGWTRSGDKYTFTFESKEIAPNPAVPTVQTTINVRASDQVGNPSASGQSVEVYLDNVPPKIDLDPRNVRLGCSGSFDVVGEASLNDLQGTPGHSSLNRRIGYFRVFVKEQTNSQPGQALFYYSLTDQASVRLYVQSNPENAVRKLLVNKNPGDDTTCDDIGGIDDIQNAPQFSAMRPIATTSTQGAAWNQNDPGVLPPPGAECELKDEEKPGRLCPNKTSDLWVAPTNVHLKEPYLYVVGEPRNDDSCAGIDLAFITASQPEGWVCVAARVMDMARNVGISPPLRLCVDDPNTPFQPPCSISSVTPPTCTDGCTPPPRGGNFTID
jgi:hypothetical protein